MGIVLVVSNYLVQFPLGDWVTWAAFTYPIAFLVTDCVNRIAGSVLAAKVAIFGFAFGVPLSFIFNVTAAPDAAWFESGRIALASGVAFACAQMIDILIFSKLRKHSSWWLPPVFSSAPASIIDTSLFFFLAFVGVDFPWVTLAIGDLAIKALMVILLLFPYRLFLQRLNAA